MMRRTFRSPSRWTWVAPVLATAFVAACDNALEGIQQQGTWGFVTTSAQKDLQGAHFANVEGLFFKGNLAAVPNAELTTDTCADVGIAEGNSLTGVTYLDAGPTIESTIGGIANILDRETTTEGLAYHYLGGPPAFTPGDSIVVSVAGVTGGYPGGSIRAKTAEAFSFPSTLDIPQGTEAIQLTWTTPQDPRSQMIVSLRYETTTNPGVLTRNVLCTFIDDGVDSIPFRWHRNWSESQGQRAVVATRLRTHYVLANGDANLGVISTYQVPTPPKP